MKRTAPFEKIYRVWSDRKEDRIAVRIRFTVEETHDGCRLFQIVGRDEWY